MTPAGRPLTERLTGWAVPETKVALTARLVVLPCITLTLPFVDMAKSIGGGGGGVTAVTVSAKVAVFTRLPAVPVTVTVEVAAGVVAAVVMVRVEVQVGLQLVLLKEAVAPVGSPLAVKLTACVVPDASVAVIVRVVELPCTTLTAPLVASAKSKAGGGGGGAVTVSVNVVVRVRLPAVPVTVTVEVPTGVAAVVGSVRV